MILLPLIQATNRLVDNFRVGVSEMITPSELSKKDLAEMTGGGTPLINDIGSMLAKPESQQTQTLAA